TERAQRGRRSFVQVCLVKSMTSSAVSFAAIVAGLSAGGAGNLAVAHSSITVCPCEPVYVERRPAMVAMPTITLHARFILDLPAAPQSHCGKLAAMGAWATPVRLAL